MKFLKDIMTEDDNETYCAARACVVAGSVSFIALAFIHVMFNHAAMDFTQFGVGFGSVLGGGGIAIGAKAATQKT